MFGLVCFVLGSFGLVCRFDIFMEKNFMENSTQNDVESREHHEWKL